MHCGILFNQPFWHPNISMQNWYISSVSGKPCLVMRRGGTVFHFKICTLLSFLTSWCRYFMRFWTRWRRLPLRFMKLNSMSSQHEGRKICGLWAFLDLRLKVAEISIGKCENFSSWSWKIAVTTFYRARNKIFEFTVSLCLMREAEIRFISFYFFSLFWKFLIEVGRFIILWGLGRKARELTQI